MSEKLKDVMAYLIKGHPDWSNGLTDTRLNNLVYLADWHQAVEYGRQITNIKWYFSKHADSGLYVYDIKDTATDHGVLFAIEEGESRYFSLKDKSFQPQLSDEARKTLDLVIEEVKGLSPDDFRKHVNETYPVQSSFKPQQPVDLVEKAKEYKQKK